MGSSSSVKEDAPNKTTNEIRTARLISLETNNLPPENITPIPSLEISSESNMATSAKTGQGRLTLQHRPSSITITSVRPDTNDEEMLETKLVKATPGLRTTFAGFEDCRKFLLDEKKRDIFYFPDLQKLLQQKVLCSFAKYEEDEIRTALGNKLAKTGFVTPLVNYYAFVLDEHGIESVTNTLFDESEDDTLDIVRVFRDVMWNFSDGSHAFTECLAETDIFQRLLGDLKDIYSDGLDYLEQSTDMFAFSSAISILHNCARNMNIDRDKFRALNATEVIRPFLKSTVLYVKMITLLTLGNIIKEKEVATLTTDEDLFEFLLASIKAAVSAKDRKCHGFHLFELLDGMASLAQSDGNKELIMSKNPLGLITKILEQGQQPPELIASVKLVWQLAFLDANKQLILKDKNLVTVLERLKNNTNYGLQYAAKKAWFVLVGMDKRIEKEPVSAASFGENKLKHIMISYNWGDKPEVLKIYSALVAQGYPVWIDIHEMGKYPNILDGMSEAVEQALVVLVCFSEKYKNSQNCRTEAEYAFIRKKEVVPLKMQRGYQADGWLGAFLGTRLYIEFSHHYPFDKQMEKLLESLPRPSTMKIPPFRSDSEGNRRSTSQFPVTHASRRTVKDWTKEDVEKWASEYKMQGSAFTKVSKMSGDQLQFIREVFTKSPGTFYTWAETKFNLGSIEELMKFSNAIQGLAQHV